MSSVLIAAELTKAQQTAAEEGSNQTQSWVAGVQGYCVRCKKRRSVAEARVSALSTGQPAHRGKCESCGTVVFRLIRGSK